MLLQKDDGSMSMPTLNLDFISQKGSRAVAAQAYCRMRRPLASDYNKGRISLRGKRTEVKV